MGAIMRALRALLLLAGFNLLGVLLLAGLAFLDCLLFLYAPPGVAVALCSVSVLPAIPVAAGLFAFRARRGEEAPGLTVTEADEPTLWQTVREVAQQVGTRAPSHVVLTPGVDASVAQGARLLPGPRRLSLGVPLLQGLTAAQLRSVLAHKLGRRSTSGSRALHDRALILRAVAHCEEHTGWTAPREQARLEQRFYKGAATGAASSGRRVRHAGVTRRAVSWVRTAYAKLFLRATFAVARAHEVRADVTAARIAGRDATASVLREVPVLEAAFEYYTCHYAALGLDAGLLPPRGEVFGGFGEMLSARQLELAGLRREIPTGPLTPYDAQPPLADRVRHIEALPPDGRTDEGRGAALSLLADPGSTLTALEDAVLTEDVRRFRRAGDWPGLLNDSMAAGLEGVDTPLHRALAMYTKAPPTLSALLGLIDDGRVWKLARRLPLSDQAAASTGRAFREFVRPALTESLHGMVLAELSAGERLHWEFSWERTPTARLRPGQSSPWSDTPLADLLGPAMTAALADHPDTGPLRALLMPTPTDPANRETDRP
ncbi:peptidase [Streptomyces sp. NPDC058867]|uniref:peptidase n=1 Tax=unclassified Streptomyces TaxID=2593676 RepID=UPI0036B61B8C